MQNAPNNENLELERIRFRIYGGKIKESRHYFDMLSFMQQLGVLPQ